MTKFLLFAALSLLMVIMAIGLGSVFIPPLTVVRILFFDGSVTYPVESAIIHSLRLPRIVMAYLTGAGLSLSGAMMQSVLKNQLASSFTIGTSTGAAVGASIAILSGATFLGMATIPFFGFVFASLTVFVSIGLAHRLGGLENTTIILVGMALSFFGSSVITILMALNSESLQRLIFWQMGSVVGISSAHTLLLFGIVSFGFLLALFKHRELDILTLDDVSANTLGVNVRGNKWFLLLLSALITGSLVSFVGIIGFVDLFTPPLARKVVGSRHLLVLPMSAILGGSFMVLSDLMARTLFSPIELPIGAVTAFIGGPLFIFLYFKGAQHAST